MNKNIENMNKNIKYIMNSNNITSSKELAELIGVKPTTWHNFQTNLSTNSTAKTAFCKYFNITIKQFEEEDLSILELQDSNLKNRFDKCPISTLSENYIYKKIVSSDANVSENEEIKDLKRKLIEKKSFVFKSAIAEARTKMENNEFVDALNSYNSAWWTLKPDNILDLCEYDLKNYIYLCKILDNSSALNELIDKLLKKELFNENLIIVLSTLLEFDFPQYAIICLKALMEE